MGKQKAGGEAASAPPKVKKKTYNFIKKKTLLELQEDLDRAHATM
jgi:hypothetical protein